MLNTAFLDLLSSFPSFFFLFLFLGWLGHASRLDNKRPVKALLYGKLRAHVLLVDLNLDTRTLAKASWAVENSKC